jgi:ergothioneine biosynthesis glutamate--cysteine ligase EgtA
MCDGALCEAGPTGCQTLLTEESAHAYLAGRALRELPEAGVGLEIESHVVDLDDPARRPSWERLQDAVGGLPHLPGRSVLSLEPGGQVELSGPPVPGAEVAVQALRHDLAITRGHLARLGLGLAPLGGDPLREPARVNPAGRYLAMEQHWSATGQGAAGRAMMSSTAAVQVNLDAGPRAGWSGRVELVHLLGPVLVAVSACSPWLSGRPTGWRSARQRVWGELDVLRCGPLRGGPDPAAEWASYALCAPVMLVDPVASPARWSVGHPSVGHPGTVLDDPVAVTDRVPLREWVSGAAVLGGRPPTLADLDRHLTTLFPPARLRGFIEVRYLDAAPEPWWPAVVATLVTLVTQPQAAAEAARAARPVNRLWTVAARHGLADPALARAARDCLAIAVRFAPAGLADEIGQLHELVAAGRSPGDQVASRAARHGAGQVLLEECRA